MVTRDTSNVEISGSIPLLGNIFFHFFNTSSSLASYASLLASALGRSTDFYLKSVRMTKSCLSVQRSFLTQQSSFYFTNLVATAIAGSYPYPHGYSNLKSMLQVEIGFISWYFDL